MTLLKLLLVPAAVWLASLAARRWGHAVSGYLGGMPLIGGPITLYLALDPGPDFAARSATLTLAAILGQAAHLLAFAHTARWGRWALSLFAGWGAYAIVSIGIAQLPLTPLGAFALALAGLALAWIALPRVHGVATVPSIPPVELWLRVGAAFALAGMILWSANVFGPVVSGILLSVPVTGSIMPPFTLALYGSGALARLLRGFVLGLTGFTAFFFTVASTVVSWGVALSFCAAVIVALASVSIATRARPVR
ncbi:MAG: hypothetical protein ACM3X5_06995 [Bacillota bacterium]